VVGDGQDAANDLFYPQIALMSADYPKKCRQNHGKTPVFAWCFINNAMKVMESGWQMRIEFLHNLL